MAILISGPLITKLTLMRCNPQPLKSCALFLIEPLVLFCKLEFCYQTLVLSLVAFSNLTRKLGQRRALRINFLSRFIKVLHFSA